MDSIRDAKARRSPPPFMTNRPARNQIQKSNWNLPKRRPRLFISLLLLALSSWLAQAYFGDFIVLLRFKLRDQAYEDSWIRRCGMRKQPLLFIQGETLAIVWETNCEESFELRYGGITAVEDGKRWRKVVVADTTWEKARINRIRMTDNRFVYQAILDELVGGRKYTYEISKRLSTRSTVVSSNKFTWSDSTTNSPSTIHLAVVSDNQYNVRIFHQILRAIISYSKAFSPPTLLIHAGDQVQNPHNLQQWQTDFYDTLTTSLPNQFGQSTPILLARGNHDWDSSGENILTGGSPIRGDWLEHKSLAARKNHPGTFYSYSVHERCRILVLDSNLLEERDLLEQEEWLEWELQRVEWIRASFRIVVVHVPPFLEYWDRKAWNEGESEWSSFVRSRLTPLLSKYGTTLVLSGHSHAYSRGFLPTPLHDLYTSTSNSSTLSLATLEAASPKIQFRTPLALKGIVYTVLGGAGGSFDVDRVEEWGFYEQSFIEQYHFGWIKLKFDRSAEEMKNDGGKDRGRVYEIEGRNCEKGIDLRDELEFATVSINSKILDKFIISSVCS